MRVHVNAFVCCGFGSLSSLQALLEAVGLPYEKLDAVFWRGHVKVGGGFGSPCNLLLFCCNGLTVPRTASVFVPPPVPIFRQYAEDPGQDALLLKRCVDANMDYASRDLDGTPLAVTTCASYPATSMIVSVLPRRNYFSSVPWGACGVVRVQHPRHQWLHP